ncbi:MAG: hypothetical protein JNJ99_02030 [Crocinitomicaceae bacterium]|nr:hypothetical protein [Crocinitomicaceae bacterium]
MSVDKAVFIKFKSLLIDGDISSVHQFMDDNFAQDNIKSANDFLIQSSNIQDLEFLVFNLSVDLSYKNDEFLWATANILIGALCYIEGAEKSAQFYLKRLCSNHSENIEYWKLYYDVLMKNGILPKAEISFVSENINRIEKNIL